MTYRIEIDDLTVRFGATTAIDGISTHVPGGRITGLIGRNGAGKSTLMSTLAGHIRPTSGAVRVDGEHPYEHARLMADTILVRDCRAIKDLSVGDAVGVASALRPRYEDDYGRRLLDRFEIATSSKVGRLSRGKHSALAVSIGLAAQAPLTMFDEPHLGMDAPSRYTFYEELITDYVRHPRSILISSHLIDELVTVIEDVLLIDSGELRFHEPIDDLRLRGASLTGPTEAVDTATLGMRVLSERTLGRTKSVVVFEPLDDRLRVRAEAMGVDVGPLPLQDFFVHLTSKETTR